MAVSYVELYLHWLKGLRNKAWDSLNEVQRGLYKACLAYARAKGRIVNGFLTARLLELMERLKAPFKAKALEVGLERARRILFIFEGNGTFKWAPFVRDWLMDRSYILFLGFMEINKPIGF